METLFSVITPSLNPGRWIRCCIASAADQTGAAVEHLVQDGGSNDDITSYLLSEPRIVACSEPDHGMYDAINRGWTKAKGEFVLHLNADEQLLPGALSAVRDCFRGDPRIDVVIAGTLICTPSGALHCYRKPLHPPLSVLLTCHHPVQSCSIFLRRSSFMDRQYLYDPGFRLISDALLMMDIVRCRKRIALLHRFTSAFFLTGENLGLQPSDRSRYEFGYQRSLAPGWLRALTPVVRTGFHIRKFLAGHYSQSKIEYDLYTLDDPTIRRRFEMTRPSGVYRPGRALRQDP